MNNKYFSFLFFIMFQLFSNTEEIDLVCNGKQDEDKKLKIGDNTTLCIHFKEIGIRMAFSIEVDKFSLFNIAGGYYLSEQFTNSKQIKNINNITLIAQIFEFKTNFPSIFYHKKDNEINYFPLLNIVIKVEKGNIYDIVWDNNCYSCKDNECMNYESVNIYNDSETKNFKNCYNKTVSCGNEKEKLNCDPKFYVTWFGTDKDNRQMKSSNMAMSKFKHYSIGSLYDNLCEAFDNQKDSINFETIEENVDDILKNDSSND